MIAAKVFSFQRVPFLRTTASFSMKVDSTSSVDDTQVSHFNQMSKQWWSENGSLKALHALNDLRVPFIRDGLIHTGIVNTKNIDSPQALKGVSILDIGCGGGILSESLARLGGTVTGLDVSSDLIEVAKRHALLDPNLKTLTYICTSPEEHAKNNEQKYDAVIASEVLEHVSDPDVFLTVCCACVKPGGSVFITTINKTFLSWVGGIVFAEYILNLVPQGTHQWEKFISPFHTQRLLEGNNCRTRVVHGMIYNIFTNTWSWSPYNNINYALHAVKGDKELKH